jgi:hypothetical protein
MNISDVALHNFRFMQTGILGLKTRMFRRPLDLSCILERLRNRYNPCYFWRTFLPQGQSFRRNLGGSSIERISLRRPQIRQQKLENIPIEQ